MALMEVKGRLPGTHLFYRGDHEQPKQLAPSRRTQRPGAAGNIEPFQARGSFVGIERPTIGLCALARERQNIRSSPASSVNRFWLNHFGRGIVNTPADFALWASVPRIRNCSIGWPANFMGWRTGRSRAPAAHRAEHGLPAVLAKRRFASGRPG